MKTESIPMSQLAELLAVQLENGEAPLRVTGTSMHPTFRSGRDSVVLKKQDTPLRKRDVILYQRKSGQYVLHRIVAQKGDLLILSGDNQFEPEEVAPSQVIARVVAFWRKGKEYPVTHLGYRLWVWLWVLVFPIRRPFLRFRRWFGRFRRKIIRRNR